MNMELMEKRARILAMRKDLEQLQVEYRQMFRALQDACHHESVMEVDDDGVKGRRVCVICGTKENCCTEAKCGYVKLSAPLAVQKVSLDKFDEYERLHELTLVFVPKPTK